MRPKNLVYTTERRLQLPDIFVLLVLCMANAGLAFIKPKKTRINYMEVFQFAVFCDHMRWSYVWPPDKNISYLQFIIDDRYT